jgi:hypothetical protein
MRPRVPDAAPGTTRPLSCSEARAWAASSGGPGLCGLSRLPQGHANRLPGRFRCAPTRQIGPFKPSRVAAARTRARGGLWTLKPFLVPGGTQALAAWHGTRCAGGDRSVSGGGSGGSASSPNAQAPWDPSICPGVGKARAEAVRGQIGDLTRQVLLTFGGWAGPEEGCSLGGATRGAPQRSRRHRKPFPVSPRGEPLSSSNGGCSPPCSRSRRTKTPGVGIAQPGPGSSKRRASLSRPGSRRRGAGGLSSNRRSLGLRRPSSPWADGEAKQRTSARTVHQARIATGKARWGKKKRSLARPSLRRWPGQKDLTPQLKCLDTVSAGRVRGGPDPLYPRNRRCPGAGGRRAHAIDRGQDQSPGSTERPERPRTGSDRASRSEHRSPADHALRARGAGIQAQRGSQAPRPQKAAQEPADGR